MKTSGNLGRKQYAVPMLKRILRNLKPARKEGAYKKRRVRPIGKVEAPNVIESLRRDRLRAQCSRTNSSAGPDESNLTIYKSINP